MRVAVALSGGVDSAVAAVLLKRQGFDVIAVTMRLLDRDPGPAGRGCCGLRAVRDARRVAARLGIPHFTIDFRTALEREVIADFIHEYARGRTPNPCIRCNDILKFQLLLNRLEEMQVDRLATGHHARIRKNDRDAWELVRGSDPQKDQSYFLYRLTQEQLARVLMPIGEHTKREVRDIACSLELAVADKRDSQEICFTPDDDYVRFLRERCPETFEPGPVLDLDGTEIGRHDGIAAFTIGQRKGLGIPFPERRYVVRMDPQSATVVLGREQEVYSRAAELEDVHWVSGRVPDAEFRAVVRIRSQHPGRAATVRPVSGSRAEVMFDEPQWAIAPGQAAVFYEADVVLGGGVIRAAGHGQDSETGEEES